MFITIKVATFVRMIAAVVVTIVILFVALANAQQSSNTPPPDRPAPTEKASALQVHSAEARAIW
jgi:hypothetical protein